MMKISNSKDYSELPVLLTLHVRAEYLDSQLNTLKDANIKNLYISIDGPRNNSDEENQSRILQIISQNRENFELIEVRHSKVNLGIAVAMISAIDWFFSMNKSGVIFEDDIQFSSDSLEYFKQALQSIEQQSDTLMASGFQPFPETLNSYCVSYTNYPQIWGWATNAEKWKVMRAYIFELPRISRKIDVAIRNFWKVGWQRVNEGYLDTWDLPIAAGMLFAGKFCVLPPVNLISNIGIDSFSTNTLTEDFPMGLKVVELQSAVDFSLKADQSEANKVNRLFDEKMYFIGNKNWLSPLFRLLDTRRFAKKKKEPLVARMNRYMELKKEIYD
jgi:GR25 family glycosyltransferase involved in LPS biosynthesis